MRRKRIFYVLNLINLISLSGLLFLVVPKEKPRQHMIRMFLPSEKKPANDGYSRFDKYYFYNTIKKKRIISIDLSQQYSISDQYLWNLKLDFIKREIETQQFTSDTNMVIKVHVGPSNTLGDVIWLFEQALFYKLRRYVFVDDHFYFLATPPPEPVSGITY